MLNPWKTIPRKFEMFTASAPESPKAKWGRAPVSQPLNLTCPRHCSVDTGACTQFALSDSRKAPAGSSFSTPSSVGCQAPKSRVTGLADSYLVCFELNPDHKSIHTSTNAAKSRRTNLAEPRVSTSGTPLPACNDFPRSREQRRASSIVELSRNSPAAFSLAAFTTSNFTKLKQSQKGHSHESAKH